MSEFPLRDLNVRTAKGRSRRAIESDLSDAIVRLAEVGHLTRIGALRASTAQLRASELDVMILDYQRELDELAPLEAAEMERLAK